MPSTSFKGRECLIREVDIELNIKQRSPFQYFSLEVKLFKLNYINVYFWVLKRWWVMEPACSAWTRLIRGARWTLPPQSGGVELGRLLGTGRPWPPLPKQRSPYGRNPPPTQRTRRALPQGDQVFRESRAVIEPIEGAAEALNLPFRVVSRANQRQAMWRSRGSPKRSECLLSREDAVTLPQRRRKVWVNLSARRS